MHDIKGEYPSAPVADEHLSDDLIAGLVEGRLDAETLATAERHLASCESCMQWVAEVFDELETKGADKTLAAGGPTSFGPLSRVGRYVIRRLLGAGAMGRVYLAHDPALDRNVALKILHAHKASADMETRLLREAKAMARLSHPEVITVYDAGRYGEQLYIAMELVEGGTLREWLSRADRSWREILAVFVRAGEGLAWAHGAGIVHRDFKPDNVLIGDDGRVRVTDFGLARAVEDADATTTVVDDVDALEEANELNSPLTRTGTLLGTPVYMAPEQHLGEPADARSDVYAFCVSLYEALYRVRPFDDEGVRALRDAKLAFDIKAPKDTHGVPNRLRRALLHGLRPRPEDRPASMKALLTALEDSARTPRLPFIVGFSALAIFIGALVLHSYSHRKSQSQVVTTASAPIACSNAACVDANGGAPAVCRADGSCAKVESEDCTAAFSPEDLRDDRTVWIGGMFPTQGPMADSFGSANAKAADFARQEIGKATSSSKTRHIALAICDDGQNPMRAAEHLVDDVRVPAILGFGSGKEIEDVVGLLLIGHRVLTMASLTSSSRIVRIPQPSDLPRMVWRTSYEVEAVADATAAFLHDVLEKNSKQEPSVVVARLDSGLGDSFAQKFRARLVYDDKATAQNVTRYQELTFSASPSFDELGKLAERVAAQAPTFVVVLGPPEDTTRVFEAIETRGARPTYVVVADSTEAFASFVGKNANRRHRLFAVANVEPAAGTHFLTRFNAAHEPPIVPRRAAPGRFRGTRTIDPSVSYDAFYLIAYATFALGDETVDGPSIARTFERLLPPGPHIEVGPTDLPSAIALLSQGKTIDLDGASGALDFDPRTGEPSVDFALVCMGLDAQGNAAGDVESGVTYRAGKAGAEGKMDCP